MCHSLSCHTINQYMSLAWHHAAAAYNADIAQVVLMLVCCCEHLMTGSLSLFHLVHGWISLGLQTQRFPVTDSLPCCAAAGVHDRDRPPRAQVQGAGVEGREAGDAFVRPRLQPPEVARRRGCPLREQGEATTTRRPSQLDFAHQQSATRAALFIRMLCCLSLLQPAKLSGLCMSVCHLIQGLPTADHDRLPHHRRPDP